MANYLDNEGILYTQEDLETAASLNGVTVEDMINENGLTPEQPGKEEGVVAKKPATTQKEKPKKSASPSTKSSSVSSGKNLFGPEVKTLTQDITQKAQTQKKQQQQKYKESKKTLGYLTETMEREKAGLPAVPALGSFGRKKFEQETEAKNKKIAEEKQALEEEKVRLEAFTAGKDLQYNTEANKLYTEAIKQSQPSQDEISELDNYIKEELAKNGATTEESDYSQVDDMGNPIFNTKQVIYNAFEDEKTKVINRLKKAGTLDKYSDDQITKLASQDYRENELKKIREDKYKDFLENNTDISEKAKTIIQNYNVKKSVYEADKFVKDNLAINELEKNQKNIINKVEKINSQLKPNNYKFTNQIELDKQNELIAERNELIGYYNQNQQLSDKLSDNIQKSSKNVEDLDLAYDMFKRDYSWQGQGEKFGANLVTWGTDLLSAGSYAVDSLINLSFGGKDNYTSWLTNNLAENSKTIKDFVNDTYAKDRNDISNVEGLLEKTANLVLDYAPDLALLYLTGGGSSLAKESIKQTAKKSLLEKGIKAATLSEGTLGIAARSTGGKYLEMVNEQKYGYYDELGNKIMPKYNSFQLIAAPITYGYTEGIFEKATAGILKRGEKFFDLVKKTQPDVWFSLAKKTGEKLLGQGVKNLGRNFAEELPSEIATNVGQNAVDKFILGKNVNLTDNTGVVFKDTALLTLALSATPMIGGAIIKPFMSETTAQKIAQNARDLAILDKALSNKDLTEIKRAKLEEQKNVIQEKSQKAINSTIENISTMPVSVYESINTSASAQAALLNKANEVNDSDISIEEKTSQLELLKNEYLKERFKLNTLTRSIENIDTFKKPINDISKAKLIKLNADRVNVSFNQDLSQSEKEGRLLEIDKQIEDIYKSNDINIVEERQKEYEQNLKVAQKLAKASDVTIIEGNNGEDLLNRSKVLLNKKIITEQDFKDVEDAIKGKTDGMFSRNGDFIFINKEISIDNKAVTVGSHEFLHKLLQKTMQNADTQINLGTALRDYLVKTNPDLYLNDKVMGRLFNNYSSATEGDFNEELLTIFSDALLKGEIKYNETVFTKLGDIIRRFLQDLGLVNISFNSGIDVYNFIKDYNNTITKDKELKGALKKVLKEGGKGELVVKEGEVTTSSKKSKSIAERMDDLEDQLMSGEIDIDLYEQKMKALEKEEYEASKKQYEEEKAEVKKEIPKKETAKKDTELSEVAAKAKAKLDAIGNDPKGFDPNNPDIYAELDKMVKAKSRNWRTNNGTVIDFTNKDKGGLDGFSMEEMTSFVRTSMLPYIQKFDPSKNNSLYGYINAQYINRMRAALKSGEVADKVFTEDVTEMKKLSEEDVQTTKPSLPERQRFQNILESGVFSPEVIADIQAKILPIIRTLKSKIDEKVSLNRTVAPIIAEIQSEIGKQADIDIKKAMGGKEGGELKKFLLNNKKAILENMTTTWLMGKDGKGGMPFAIQKRINGQWVNYPDWVGKKIDRESTSTDLAGRTAGHELVRRLPNVNNNVDNDTFLASIIDLETGNPLRGRKESLAKALAEEIAMDIMSDDMANEGILSQAFEKNQLLLGAAAEKIIEQEFLRLSERGNVKFSISNSEINGALKHFIDKGSFRAAMIEKAGTTNPFKAFYNKLISNDFTDDELTRIFERYNDLLYKIGHAKHEAFIGSIVKKDLTGTTYSSKVFGGNNNYNPDILIGIGKNSASIKKENTLNVVVEVKKNIFARMTSATLNVIKDKYSNTEWGQKLLNEYNNFKQTPLFKEIGNYLSKETEAGGYKITDVIALKNLLKNKKLIIKAELPVDSVLNINKNKAFSNDLLIIGTSLTDYFSNDFFSNYNLIDENGNINKDIISAQVELKISSDGFLRPRVYFYINREVANNINKIASKKELTGLTNKVNEIITAKANLKFSKSSENNLNLNNDFNYNITNVSDYIKENNIKRINGEDAFDVLNDLVKRVEDFWGIVPNETIVGMNRAIDYAFDVIEDREGEGDIMSTLNENLNLETIKNAEKQLNEFVQNNINKKPLYSKSLSFDFNKMLEENKGVDEFKKISDVVAKRTGRQVNRFSFFVPPSADDFMGLTSYMFAASGKKGEADQEFFDRNLIVPYVKGVNTLDSVRQSIKKEYKALLDQYPAIKKKLEKLTPDKQFTYDQAIRVYLWNLGGIDVPGLTKGDKGKLTYFVKQDQDLVQFANALSVTGRQNGSWIPPSTTWDSETIISDLHNITEGDGRKKWLSEFIENADAIFSKENLNKVEFIYGTAVRQALEDSLYRMKNGKSRPQGADAITNKWMNWINGSTAAIMFFNTRSALLQTISALNFINVSDNNPYKAAKAFADQKQYWSDFAKIINSDKLKERRAGLKSDVTQAEIANAANDAKNKFNGVISYLQKIGFTPTQAADSFAIAVTGATFYRNRVNTYLKNGLSEKEAEDKAWIDFSMVTDKSMQSADPMYVSKQQTTALGRLILAFGNTPMQYNRLIKKASLDLVNRRGDWKENISKIIYYGALQNFIFSALQAALFLPFDDEEEDLEKMTKEQRKEYEKLKKKQDDKAYNILNGMLDTVLRGSGVGGAVVATIKNAIVEYNKQEEREMFADHAYTILAATSVSPPISSKLRKLYSVHRTSKFEKDVIQERGWEVTRDGRLNLSPKYNMVGSGVTAITNIPLDRLVEKTNNIAEALDDRNTKLQRTALMLGWKNWELNVKNEENEIIKAEAREKRKKEGIEKAIETRYAKKEAEKEAYRRMSPEEKFQYRRKKIKEKREKAIEKRERARAIRRKRRMG